jgi:hypothetical protein
MNWLYFWPGRALLGFSAGGEVETTVTCVPAVPNSRLYVFFDIEMRSLCFCRIYTLCEFEKQSITMDIQLISEFRRRNILSRIFRASNLHIAMELSSRPLMRNRHCISYSNNPII